jgi:hypothetical protein
MLKQKHYNFTPRVKLVIGNPCLHLVKKKVISLVITAPSLLKESHSNLKVNL